MLPCLAFVALFTMTCFCIICRASEKNLNFGLICGTPTRSRKNRMLQTVCPSRKNRVTVLQTVCSLVFWQRADNGTSPHSQKPSSSHGQPDSSHFSRQHVRPVGASEMHDASHDIAFTTKKAVSVMLAVHLTVGLGLGFLVPLCNAANPVSANIEKLMSLNETNGMLFRDIAKSIDTTVDTAIELYHKRNPNALTSGQDVDDENWNVSCVGVWPEDADNHNGLTLEDVNAAKGVFGCRVTNLTLAELFMWTRNDMTVTTRISVNGGGQPEVNIATIDSEVETLQTSLNSTQSSESTHSSTRSCRNTAWASTEADSHARPGWAKAFGFFDDPKQHLSEGAEHNTVLYLRLPFPTDEAICPHCDAMPVVGPKDELQIYIGRILVCSVVASAIKNNAGSNEFVLSLPSPRSPLYEQFLGHQERQDWVIVVVPPSPSPAPIDTSPNHGGGNNWIEAGHRALPSSAYRLHNVWAWHDVRSGPAMPSPLTRAQPSATAAATATHHHDGSSPKRSTLKAFSTLDSERNLPFCNTSSDISKGEWVRDVEEPGVWMAEYDNPRYSRAGSKHKVRYRWKASECLLPSFDPHDMCRVLKNRSVLLVGDSLTYSHFLSFALMLGAQPRHFSSWDLSSNPSNERHSYAVLEKSQPAQVVLCGETVTLRFVSEQLCRTRSHPDAYLQDDSIVEFLGRALRRRPSHHQHDTDHAGDATSSRPSSSSPSPAENSGQFDHRGSNGDTDCNRVPDSDLHFNLTATLLRHGIFGPQSRHHWLDWPSLLPQFDIVIINCGAHFNKKTMSRATIMMDAIEFERSIRASDSKSNSLSEGGAANILRLHTMLTDARFALDDCERKRSVVPVPQRCYPSKVETRSGSPLHSSLEHNASGATHNPGHPGDGNGDGSDAAQRHLILKLDNTIAQTKQRLDVCKRQLELASSLDPDAFTKSCGHSETRDASMDGTVHRPEEHTDRSRSKPRVDKHSDVDVDWDTLSLLDRIHSDSDSGSSRSYVRQIFREWMRIAVRDIGHRLGLSKLQRVHSEGEMQGHTRIFFRTTNIGHAGCTNASETPLTHREDIAFDFESRYLFHWDLFGFYNSITKSVIEEFNMNQHGDDTARESPQEYTISVLDTSPVDLRRDDHLYDISSLTGDRVGRKAKSDCLHYHLPGPPDFYTNLLYSTLLAEESSEDKNEDEDEESMLATKPEPLWRPTSVVFNWATKAENRKRESQL